VSPRNPLNIGAAARAMSNFGYVNLRLVSPYEVAFREARSAVGAGQVLKQALVFSTLQEAVADCTLVVGTVSKGHRELLHPLRRLEYGARLIRKEFVAGRRVGLLFGSEKFGLSNEDLSLCHWLMTIPTRAEHESMNLGQAVALCLYELARSPAASRQKPHAPKKAASADLGRITEALLDVLERCGYTNPKTLASTRLKISRLVRRMNLDAKDAVVWQGILRQIRWKLGSGEKGDG
jgi:tRNA/rRNA methyltransferase